VSVRSLKNPREGTTTGETRRLCGYRFPRTLLVTFNSAPACVWGNIIARTIRADLPMLSSRNRAGLDRFRELTAAQRERERERERERRESESRDRKSQVTGP